MGIRKKSGGSAVVDVAAMLDTLGVAEALAELVQLGALVSVSTTRDGGALGLTVTIDGEWDREYFRDGESLQAYLAEAMPDFRDFAETAAASSERGNRSRGRRGR